jgi:hypothetical protein
MNGEFVKSDGSPDAIVAVIPDSSGEAVLKIACEQNFPKDTSGKNYFKASNNDVFLATKMYVEYMKSLVDAAPK